MKKIVSVVCLILALVAPVLVPETANAERRMAVSGTIVFGTNPPPLKVVAIGGYTVYTDNLDGVITGTIQSPKFIFIRTLIIHSNGEFDITGQITGTATIFGRSGGFTQRITGTGTPMKAIHGQWVIMNGTGGLEGLHGEGTFSGIAGQASDYAGRIYFDNGRGKEAHLEDEQE